MPYDVFAFLLHCKIPFAIIIKFSTRWMQKLFRCSTLIWTTTSSCSHGRHKRIKFGKYIFAMFMIIFNASMLSHHHNYRLSLFLSFLYLSLTFPAYVWKAEEKKQLLSENHDLTQNEKFYLSPAMHKPVHFV